MTTEDVMLALHEVAGVCGHCGKRKCPGRKSQSVLPNVLKIESVERALNIAEEATGEEMLERTARRSP